jgi:superfamily II DNA or RNA helicase
VTETVRLDGMISVPRSLLSPGDIADLRRRYSLPNPAAVQANRRGAYAFGVRDTVSPIAFADDEIRFPPGLRAEVAKLVRGKDFTIDDRRPHFAPIAIEYSGELRPEQVAALEALLSTKCGIGVAPPGFGKTEVGCAQIARLGLRTIALTNSKDLASQWIDRIRQRLGIDAGFIGDGVFDVRDVTVALVQSLSPDVVARIADKFEVGIFDECHHAASPTAIELITSLPVSRWYGFTATIEREDGLGKMVEWLIGPVVSRVRNADLVAAGRLSSARYIPVRTSFGFEYFGPDDYAPLLEALVAHEDRNAEIADLVAAECRGEVGLVLSGRVAHCGALAKLIADRGLRVAVMTGSLSRKKRDAILDAARAGELDCVVATQVFDEGVDCPRLSRLFLVFPQKAEGRFVQRVGRILRLHPEKAEPAVFDFVDSRVGVLEYQAGIRARTFRKAFGSPTEVRRVA